MQQRDLTPLFQPNPLGASLETLRQQLRPWQSCPIVLHGLRYARCLARHVISTSQDNGNNEKHVRDVGFKTIAINIDQSNTPKYLNGE
jgi:hypothetical protein